LRISVSPKTLLLQSLSLLVKFWIARHFHITLRKFFIVLVRDILGLSLCLVLLRLSWANVGFWVFIFTFLKVLLFLNVFHVCILIIVELRIFFIIRSIFIWVHLRIIIVLLLIIFIRLFKAIILWILIVHKLIFLVVLKSATWLVKLSLGGLNWLLYTNSWSTLMLFRDLTIINILSIETRNCSLSLFLSILD
jgi:hypothetical protein